MLDRFLRCTISLEQNMIEFIAEHPTSIKCCSTHHMENGRLLVAGYEGISEIIHFEDKFKDSLTESAGIVTSITHDAVNSYCLTHFGKNKTVSQCVTPHDFDDLEPLISLEHETNSASFLAILPSRRIAVTDEKSLIIYDLVNRKQTCHNISYSAHGLMSLPGEEKLILTASDKIFCYEIPTHGDIEMIWMCECGSNISGVCNMGFGQIALPVAFEDRLYVVDAENGQFMVFYQCHVTSRAFPQLKVMHELYFITMGPAYHCSRTGQAIEMLYLRKTSKSMFRNFLKPCFNAGLPSFGF